MQVLEEGIAEYHPVDPDSFREWVEFHPAVKTLSVFPKYNQVDIVSIVEWISSICLARSEIGIQIEELSQTYDRTAIA